MAVVVVEDGELQDGIFMVCVFFCFSFWTKCVCFFLSITSILKIRPSEFILNRTMSEEVMMNRTTSNLRPKK